MSLLFVVDTETTALKPSEGGIWDAAAEQWPHYDAQADEGGDEADSLWLLNWVQCGMPERAQPEKRKRGAR